MAKKLGEIYVDITGRLAKLKGAMAKGKRLLVGWSKNLTKWMKRGGIAIGIALVAALTLATRSAITFEKQMAKIATMLTKQTMKYIPRFGRAIKDLAIKFGEGVVSITEAMYSILSASIAPGKAIKFLIVSMRAAKAGFTDTATAAYVLTGVMNAYGFAADKAGKISDILFAIQKKGQTSFGQFAPVLGRVTSLAAALGVRLEEVAAALSTLTRSGISTAESITYLRGLIVALSGKSIEGIRVAKEYGIELSVSALQTKGLTGMMKDLSKVSDDVLKRIVSETEARTGLSVLLKNMVGYEEDLNEAMNAGGLTMEAYEKQTTTLSFKLGQLWQSIKSLAIDSANTFMPMMKKAVDSLVKRFSDMRDELNALWYGVGEDYRKFLKILFQIASAKMGQFAKDMSVYGRRSADAFVDGYGKRIKKWWRKGFLGEEGQFGYISQSEKSKKREEEADNKRKARLQAGYDEELAMNQEVADAKITEILKVANIAEGREEYLTLLAEERAERESEAADDKVNDAEIEAKRLKGIAEKTERLAAKLAEEREQTLKDETIERLKNLKAMYASMKGYEEEYARVQRALWREQAREYAKTGLVTAEKAYAGLAAKDKDKSLGKAADSGRSDFVSFQQMWNNISRQLVSKQLEEQQLKAQEEAVRQLQNVNRGIGAMTTEIRNIEGGFTD